MSGVKSEPSERLECAGEANAATRGFKTLTTEKGNQWSKASQQRKRNRSDQSKLTIVDEVRRLVEGSAVAKDDEGHGGGGGRFSVWEREETKKGGNEA